MQGPTVWAKTLDLLQETVAPEAFQNWLSDLKYVAQKDDTVLIGARQKYTFERVVENHRHDIHKAWRACDPQARKMELICWASRSAELKNLVEHPWKAKSPARTSGQRKSVTLEQSFDTLVTGDSNSVAAGVMRDIVDGDKTPAGSLFFLSGPQGVGKTHVVRAMEAAVEHAADGRQVAYITAEEFLSAYVDGARNGDTTALKKRLRECDILVVDDLQRLAGKTKTNEELFSTVRTVMARGAIVIVTADALSSELDGLTKNMRNQLTGAVKIEVGLPDDEMRAAILERQAALIAERAPAFVVTGEMRSRILRRVRGPGRAICAVLWSLYTEARCGREAPTLKQLDAILHRQEGGLKPVTLDAIKRATCRVFDITKAELESACKQQALVYPRHLSVYLCRSKTDKSYPQIARAFGNRDHTTCMYSVKKITKDLNAKDQVRADLDRINAALFDILSGHDD